MPTLRCAEFAPPFDETMTVIGWTSAVPWRSVKTVIEAEQRMVMSKTEYEACTLARSLHRPGSRHTKLRKPRWS